MVHFDDVMLFLKSVAEHIEHVDMVLNHLKVAGILLKMDK